MLLVDIIIMQTRKDLEMNITPLYINEGNNYSNPKLNNLSFNGSVHKSVYDFVKKAEKIELQVLNEHANSIISQRKINSIKNTWKSALEFLELMVSGLHKDTEIEVITDYSKEREYPLHGYRHYKTEVLRAHNYHVGEMSLSELTKNEQYEYDRYKKSENVNYPNDYICTAKEFLRAIKSINFARLDKKLYNLDKRSLLECNVIIPENTIEYYLDLGKDMGYKHNKLLRKRIDWHNKRILNESKTKMINSGAIKGAIKGLEGAK